MFKSVCTKKIFERRPNQRFSLFVLIKKRTTHYVSLSLIIIVGRDRFHCFSTDGKIFTATVH